MEHSWHIEGKNAEHNHEDCAFHIELSPDGTGYIGAWSQYDDEGFGVTLSEKDVRSLYSMLDIFLFHKMLQTSLQNWRRDIRTAEIALYDQDSDRQEMENV